MSEWRYDKPPNEEVVIVEYKGKLIKVLAIWGRDGTLPHWESEGRNSHWHPSAFSRWRLLKEGDYSPSFP